MSIPPILQQWFTVEAIDRRTLCRWLEPEACRLAACYWWPTLPNEDLQGMMRLHASLLIKRPYAQGLSPQVIEQRTLHQLAQAVLEDAIRTMWVEHDQSYREIFTVAAAALKAGAAREDIVQAAIETAKKRSPLPPPWLVEEAIDKAAKEHRFDARFWQQRRRRAG